MFEEIELLEGLKSVDGKNEIIWGRHTESGHEILDLDIIEDHGGDVMGVLLGHGFVWSGLDGGDKVGSISFDGGGDLSAEFSSVVVSLLLRVGDSE